MGIGGLALSAAVSSTAAAAVLLIPAVKQYPDILDKGFVLQIGRMLLAAAGMLVPVLGCKWLLLPRLGGRVLGQILLLCICGGVGVTAYMLFARLLKIEEGEFVFGMLKRLRHRGGGETTQGAPRKRKKRRTYTMTEKISAIIEDSFCFRLLAAICTLLRSVWMNSIAYSIYAAICRGFKNAFENSAILGFFAYKLG